MWRTFLVATDQEEWEGVWDDLIKSRNNADRFLEDIKGKKLRWLLHKVKTQFHHSRSFHVTGSRAAQRERLMNFFRNCGEIIQREQAVAAAAAEFQEARKRLTSDPGRMHLDEYARLVALFFAPRHRQTIDRYLLKSDTRRQVDAKQAATFTNTIARIYLDHTNEFTLPSGFSKDPSDPFYGVDPNSEHIDYTRDPCNLQQIWAEVRSEYVTCECV